MLSRAAIVDLFIGDISDGKRDFRYDHLLDLARDHEINHIALQFLFPGKMDDVVAELWQRYSLVIKENCQDDQYQSLSFSRKVIFLLHATLDYISRHRKFWLSVMSLMVKPSHFRLLRRTLMNWVNFILHMANDRSNDFNYYTKRAVLFSICIAVITHWCICDDLQKSKDFATARVGDTKIIGTVKTFFRNIFRMN